MSNKGEYLEENFFFDMINCCLRNKTILDIVIEHVRVNYLSEEDQRFLYKEIINQYKITGKIPSYTALRMVFRKNHDILELISNCNDFEEPSSEEQILISLQEFIIESMYSETLTKSAEQYNLGNKKKAFTIFKTNAEKLSKFSLSSDFSERIFADFDTRNLKRLAQVQINERIPTCIDELDRLINGGFEKGELIMFLAQSKGGKSFCLTHLGLSAARMGYGVAHFQAEGTRKECTNRYDSCWTGTRYYDIKEGNIREDKYESLRKTIKRLSSSDIHIICEERFDSMTVVGIRRKIIELKKKFKIDVVIIDYMDLINPDDHRYSPSEERQRLEKVNRMLKDLAVEQNVLIYTATQASSVKDEDLNDPNFVLKREHLAEHKGKVFAVDGLISINKTSSERKSKTCRLYTEAFRGHDSGQTIFIKQNLDLSKFYDRSNTLKEFLD